MGTKEKGEKAINVGEYLLFILCLFPQLKHNSTHRLNKIQFVAIINTLRTGEADLRF